MHKRDQAGTRLGLQLTIRLHLEDGASGLGSLANSAHERSLLGGVLGLGRHIQDQLLNRHGQCEQVVIQGKNRGGAALLIALGLLLGL